MISAVNGSNPSATSPLPSWEGGAVIVASMLPYLSTCSSHESGTNMVESTSSMMQGPSSVVPRPRFDLSYTASSSSYNATCLKDVGSGGVPIGSAISGNSNGVM